MSCACAGKRCCSGSNRFADDTFAMNLGVYFHPELNVTSKGSASTQRSRTCIVFSVGRKYLHAVTMDGTIGCVEIDKDTKLEPLMLKGQPYPIQRAAELYLKSTLTKTDCAVKELTKLLNTLPIDPEALLLG